MTNCMSAIINCVYYDDGDCKTSIDICQNVIKKCLEQE